MPSSDFFLTDTKNKVVQSFLQGLKLNQTSSNWWRLLVNWRTGKLQEDEFAGGWKLKCCERVEVRKCVCVSGCECLCVCVQLNVTMQACMLACKRTSAPSPRTTAAEVSALITSLHLSPFLPLTLPFTSFPYPTPLPFPICPPTYTTTWRSGLISSERIYTWLKLSDIQIPRLCDEEANENRSKFFGSWTDPPLRLLYTKHISSISFFVAIWPF